MHALLPDHYGGLNENFKAGRIYASEVTARLVKHMLGVDPALVVALPMLEPTEVDGTSVWGHACASPPRCARCAGVQVILVDANHCPGAVQFLFHLPDGRRYVHTGDMRFSPSLLDVAPLRERFHNPDILYLDTTYSNPKYTFPPQVVSCMCECVCVQVSCAHCCGVCAHCCGQRTYGQRTCGQRHRRRRLTTWSTRFATCCHPTTPPGVSS